MSALCIERLLQFHLAFLGQALDDVQARREIEDNPRARQPNGCIEDGPPYPYAPRRPDMDDMLALARQPIIKDDLHCNGEVELGRGLRPVALLGVVEIPRIAD